MFWAGFPFEIKAFQPWNFELDINYCHLEEMGRFDAVKYEGPGDRRPQVKRSSTRCEGWLVKGLLEYGFDWGVPGILGWYSTGVSSNSKNGSIRIPTIVGWGNFTSFMGDGGRHTWRLRDINSTYAGTWGVGAQIRNISLIEDISHDARVVYWGGTNSPGMVK